MSRDAANRQGTRRASFTRRSGCHRVGNGPLMATTPAKRPGSFHARRSAIVPPLPQPARKTLRRMNVEASRGGRNAIGDTRLGRFDVVARLSPGISVAVPACWVDGSPRGDGHVISHAHQRHHVPQFALAAGGAVQPHDQRIRIARFVVDRCKRRKGFARDATSRGDWQRSLHQAIHENRQATWELKYLPRRVQYGSSDKWILGERIGAGSCDELAKVGTSAVTYGRLAIRKCHAALTGIAC